MPPRLCLILTLCAAALPAHRLPIKVYTTINGMPRNSARCLVPDPNGMLWICTSEGLVRFDGYEFRVFGPEQGLPSRSIFDFAPSRRGGYWVAGDGGLCRLPAGSKIGAPCRPLPVEGSSGGFEPNAVIEAPDGNVWVATREALFHVSVDGQKIEPTPIRFDPGNLLALEVAPDGSLLAASEYAIYQWKPGQAPRDITPRFAYFRGSSQIMTTPAGDVWVVTPSRLYRMTGWGKAAEPAIQVFDFPPGQSFSSILRRRDGSLWIAGAGIARVELGVGGKLIEAETYSSREGLPADGVAMLAEDRQGNLWGSTEGAGIFRIALSGFKVYSKDDGFPNARIAAVFESLRGDLCVINSVMTPADFPNLGVRNGSRFERVGYRRPPGVFYAGWGWSQFGLQAHDGEWWIPTGRGLFRFARAARPQDLNGRSPMAVYDSTSALGQTQIFRVFEDSHGDVWIVSLSPSNALLRWERQSGRFHRWTPAEGWSDNGVAVVIREAPSGTLWFGSFVAILRFRNQRFERVAGLPSAQTAGIRDLYIDGAGRVWIATDHGLYRCDNPDAPQPVFRSYTTREGLSSDSVRSIVEDDAGRIYAATVRGIDRIDPQAPPGGFRIRHFTTADGVPDSEPSVAFRDRHGHLWFGTFNGLAEFDPSKAPPLVLPEVYVTRLRIRGEEIPLPWGGARSLHTDLASDKKQVEIQYAGVDLRSVASLRYQYRLLGVDRDWSDPVTEMTVNYASLPSGKLRFEVRALTGDGQIGSGLASLDLWVQAPLWQRWWFIALAVAVLALIAGALFKYRVEQLLAMERLRTRIASDLHDDIGASLTQISILTELARRGGSRDVLEDVAGMARELVEDMSDIVWAVNPRHDRFEALAHRMRRFAGDTLGDIDLEFDAANLPADFSVPLEYRRPLYLVFKEAAHNVARHSGATRAMIRIELSDATLKLTVEDNGCGFDPQAPRRGEGVNSIQRRMRDIGGAAWWEPAAPPGSEGGTRFTAVLPLRSARSLHTLGGIFARHAR